MTAFSQASDTPRLARHAGQALYAAPEAMLKGVLESEAAVDLIVGPSSGQFTSLHELLRDDAISRMVRAHGLRVMATPDATRAIALAAQAARAGRRALALVPNRELDRVAPALARVAGERLASGGALGLILEDDLDAGGAAWPRQFVFRIDLPCLEPMDLQQLRDGMELTIRLSRAGLCAVGMIVQARLLRSSDTLEARPNRVIESIDAMLARRRKRRRAPRSGESGGLLRMARRLELNRFRCVPSPGERVPVGFITVGPAEAALAHVVHALNLTGRVPVLQLALVHPVDESVVERLLSRCVSIIVLELRPGEFEPQVLSITESMRRRGERPGTVWGRVLPGAPNEPAPLLKPGDTLHPSLLARKIVHLLHTLRPTLQIASQLVPDAPVLPIRPPDRGAGLGASGAIAFIRKALAEVDQWLREQALDPEVQAEPSALVIDGAAQPDGQMRRLVSVEIWGDERFALDGVAALRQAAFDPRPWLLIVCHLSQGDPQELERFIRGAVPGERADRVAIEVVNLADRDTLIDRLREASMSDRLTVVVASDGPPPRYSIVAMETALAEIDRLGFRPRKRIVVPADEDCAVEAPPIEDTEDLPIEQPELTLGTQIVTERVAHTGRRQMQMRVRPLLEEIEVVRTRAPVTRGRAELPARLSPPTPVHAQRPLWRAHIAGYRGHSPGVVATVLRDAGEAMGYHVKTIHDDATVAAGRRAWAQILFTRSRPEQPPLHLTAEVPFGEADLVLGTDAIETLRALGLDGHLRVAHADRTHALVNLGRFEDDPEIDPGPWEEALVALLNGMTVASPRMATDFAAVCRRAFHTDRVADVALLGAAYQHGLIPVSGQAIDIALARLESAGYGRLKEVFQLGRRLAVDERLFEQAMASMEEDAAGMARRVIRMVHAGWWRWRRRGSGIQSLVELALASTPGLAETDAGRHARREMVAAITRCLAWGGLAYAEQFVELLLALYESDRGDTGRALTRHAVLPLANVMLIPDPLYIAAMAIHPEHHRRIRRRLNVKLARGDRVERRYLTRIDLTALGWRVRMNVRTSDWPARLLGLVGRVVPVRWRGTASERQVRDYVFDLVRRAAHAEGRDYARWVDLMRRLREHAAEGRLRTMTVAELRSLVEPEASRLEPPVPPAPEALHPAASQESST